MLIFGNNDPPSLIECSTKDELLALTSTTGLKLQGHLTSITKDKGIVGISSAAVSTVSIGEFRDQATSLQRELERNTRDLKVIR